MWSGARRFVVDNHLTMVEVLHADALATDLPGQTFDLAIPRLVLIGVLDPEPLVKEMGRLVPPGASLPDMSRTRRIARRSLPPRPNTSSPSSEHLCANHGWIVPSAPELPRMLRHVGLVEVRVNLGFTCILRVTGVALTLLEFIENVRG